LPRLGITSDIGPAAEPQPALRTPTRIAWTQTTLDQIGAGNAEHGAFIALNCTACHGHGGRSTSTLIPTLAGMDAAVTYKQLDDYRSGKRLWGVMGALAKALSAQDSADAAAYFAAQPRRGIPPCAACHGPGGYKLGAPALQGQHAAYVERQLAAFAQGMRQNDIFEQMRIIAKQLTPEEMHALAAFYGAPERAPVANK
jgi:cytochrome c553